LDDPQYTIVIHYANGEEQTLYIGDENPSKTGFYAYRSGLDRIFVISALNKYSLTLDYFGLWQVPSFTGAEETITRVRVERYETQEVIDLLVVESGTYGNVNTGRLVEPYDIQVDADAQAEFIALVASQIVGPSALVNPEPTQADLEAYGLTNPAYRLSVTANGETIDMVLGNLFSDEMSVENAYRYCLVNGETAVYRFNVNDGAGILDVQASSLADPLLNYISISYLERLEFQHGDTDLVVDVQQIYTDEDGNTLTQEEAEGMKNVTIDQIVTIDGVEIPRKTFGSWYEYPVGLRVYGELPADYVPEGEPVATLRCVLNTRSTALSQRVIKFYEYKRDFYALEIDGNFDFYVAASALTDISDNLNILYDAMDQASSGG